MACDGFGLLEARRGLEMLRIGWASGPRAWNNFIVSVGVSW